MASLQKNQVVIFENGAKAGWDQAVWSEKHQAFCIATDEIDENGKRKLLYSNNVTERTTEKRMQFKPTSKNCVKRIYPLGETDKAYQIEDGSNGKIGNHKEYYKYIPKSICYIDKNGVIYAPAWA